MRSQSETIDLLFHNRLIDEVREHLDSNPDIDLLRLRDRDGNTVLHQLAFEGHIDIIRLFVREAKRRLVKHYRKSLYQRSEKQEIKVWMDLQNSEGFTPILYAAYNGHIDIIKYFVQDHEVSYNLTTNTGLNILHCAAQRNMVLPMLYFRGKLDLNSKDQLNSTSLHWASYMNCEQVAQFLLCEETLDCLDARDSEGNTPLMLAVMYGNTRVVRRLLIRGADRYLDNKDGKIAIDIAREQQYKTITRMLDENYTCCDWIRFYCNVKLEYRPKKRKLTIPFVFIISLILNIGILNLGIVFYEWYPIYIEILVVSTMSILYLTLLRGPQLASSREEQELFRVGTEKQFKKYCFECKTDIPKRGYHCDICHVCISQYDHHCTWINNCVGKRNIGRFVFYLIFLLLSLIFIGFISVLAEISIVLDDPEYYGEWLQLRFVYQDVPQRVGLGLLFAVNFITSLFVFPVFMLFIVQIKNLLKNRTTYEMMRAPAEEDSPIKSKMKKYKSRMSLKNCKYMCSDNPVYMKNSLSSNDMLDEATSPGMASRK